MCLTTTESSQLSNKSALEENFKKLHKKGNNFLSSPPLAKLEFNNNIFRKSTLSDNFFLSFCAVGNAAKVSPNPPLRGRGSEREGEGVPLTDFKHFKDASPFSILNKRKQFERVHYLVFHFLLLIVWFKFT